MAFIIVPMIVKHLKSLKIEVYRLKKCTKLGETRNCPKPDKKASGINSWIFINVFSKCLA